jgi:hypothetical protein
VADTDCEYYSFDVGAYMGSSRKWWRETFERYGVGYPLDWSKLTPEIVAKIKHDHAETANINPDTSKLDAILDRLGAKAAKE